MYDGIRSTGWETVVFFLVMVPLLTMIILNLLVAILLTHFVDDSHSEEGDGMERCCCCFVIGPKQEEQDLLGSLSCCRKKSRSAVLPLEIAQSKTHEGATTVGVVQSKTHEGATNSDVVQSKTKRILEASQEQLIAMGGPLTRWLADCEAGMEQHVFDFYVRGVKHVSDFATLCEDDFEKLGLGREQINKFREKIEKTNASSEIDMLYFEELKLLQICKLLFDEQKSFIYHY